MQLALLALAAACAPCGCRMALLARRQPTGALGDPVDPMATEAAAAVSPAAVGAHVPGQVDLEMASTNPQLVALAEANVSSFAGEIIRRVATALQAPPERFTVTPQSQLAAPAPPAPALLQARGVAAVMWVLHIGPVPVPNVTNATNVTANVTVLVCPPCPCPEDPTPAPLVLPPNSTAVMPTLSEPSAEQLGSELVLMSSTPRSILQGLLPQTTARTPGGLFPAPESTSVALGSRVAGPTPADEAFEINEGTRQMVQAIRTQLKAANEARAKVLTSGAEPPQFTGKLPLPSSDTDPWSAMKDDSALGRSAS